ncbi:hypothetical protein ACFVMC_18025 [Nocardia sp. NPDC127579]|uniref:hypothetical protein n=1 Tax=Nocardia sp. NPDC127579 TaxID=3345402 RepID=UPI003639647E
MSQPDAAPGAPPPLGVRPGTAYPLGATCTEAAHPTAATLAVPARCVFVLACPA